MPLQPNQYVTSANSKSSLYITREEVITALSTIAGDLSGASTSTLFYNPNLNLSTLTMNPSGQISGFVPHQASKIVLQAGTGLNQAAELRLGSVGNNLSSSLMSCDFNGNAAPMRANNFIANAAGSTGFSAGWGFSSNGFTAFDGGYNQTPVLTWQFGNVNRIALSNISSINGSPPNVNPTTYTNLSGNNITNSQVITTPSLVSVSSINGSNINNYINQSSWVQYTVTNTAVQSNAFNPGTPAPVLTFANLPITAAVNRAVNISVPIAVTPSVAVPADCRLNVIAWIGGAQTGGTTVSQSIYFRAGSTAPVTITLSGTCIVNGNQAVLTIGGLLDAPGATSFNLVQGATTFNRFFFQQIV